jgi:hypothetical protein
MAPSSSGLRCGWDLRHRLGHQHHHHPSILWRDSWPRPSSSVRHPPSCGKALLRTKMRSAIHISEALRVRWGLVEETSWGLRPSSPTVHSSEFYSSLNLKTTQSLRVHKLAETTTNPATPISDFLQEQGHLLTTCITFTTYSCSLSAFSLDLALILYSLCLQIFDISLLRQFDYLFY